MGKIELTAPRPGGDVTVTISHGKWEGADSKLIHALQGVYLDSGHHPDRDLELAKQAAAYLGGTVKDNRETPRNLHKLPL